MGCEKNSLETPTVYVSLKPLNVSAIDSARQWPGWRGALRHGIAHESNFPTTWQVEQEVRWKASVPGIGNSSPVVWGDRVWLTSIVAAENGQRAVILAFDRTYGQLVWQTDVGAPQGTTHSKNGFASATVTTDGTRVFASFPSLGLFALDMQGNVLWHAASIGGKHEWGQAASPLLFENLVLHVGDGDGSSAIAAYDQTTGREVWKTPRQSRGSWSSPVLMNAGTSAEPQWQVIVNGTGSGSGSAGEVIAYDPRSGAEIWKARGTTDIACPTAIVGDGLLVSASGGNGPIFAIRPNGRGDVTNSHVAWRLSSGGPYVPTGVIYRDHLYLISDGGMATCHRLNDGAIVWRKRL